MRLTLFMAVVLCCLTLCLSLKGEGDFTWTNASTPHVFAV